jgi:hypothetical protein
MNDHDYGPLQTFEVNFRDRAPEMIQGHQVLFDSGGIFGAPAAVPMIKIHGMFPGKHWRLMLMAPESDILSIRNVTEQLAALEAMAQTDGPA